MSALRPQTPSGDATQSVWITWQISLRSHRPQGHGHPQDDEGDLTIFVVIAQHVEVRELELWLQGIEVMFGDLEILADRRVDIMEGLNCMVLVAELFIDPVETICLLRKPFSLGSL